MKKLYYDIETQEYITFEQLEKEYKEKIQTGEIEITEQTNVNQYINNCLTRNNGTLEVVTSL